MWKFFVGVNLQMTIFFVLSWKAFIRSLVVYSAYSNVHSATFSFIYGLMNGRFNKGLNFMNRNDFLLSMIIPVYNVGPYLERCLDSCLAQCFEGYEIICIDDGSTDSSGAILDLYCEENQNRIKVVHTDNSGVSEARNQGIRLARGKYIWFIDPDDFISENVLIRIVSVLSNVDLLVLPYAEVKEDNYDLQFKKYTRNDESENEFSSFYSVNKFDKVWNYIVSKDVILNNDLFFGKGIVLAEDYIFDFFLKEHIKSWKCFDCTAYYHVIRNHSASQGHIHNKEYYRRKIDNSLYTALYIKHRIPRYNNEGLFIIQAQKKMYDTIRITINTAVKLGDVKYLDKTIQSLRDYDMYPYPIQLSTKSQYLISNLTSSLFNFRPFAIVGCFLYGLFKNCFFQETKH